jgi:hypothetical protein
MCVPTVQSQPVTNQSAPSVKLAKEVNFQLSLKFMKVATIRDNTLGVFIKKIFGPPPPPPNFLKIRSVSIILLGPLGFEVFAAMEHLQWCHCVFHPSKVSWKQFSLMLSGTAWNSLWMSDTVSKHHPKLVLDQMAAPSQEIMDTALYTLSISNGFF